MIFFPHRKRTERDWMQTFSGAVYYPAAPRVQDVRIVDIAHHLSMLCRYTGACRKFYSVAEHSILVSQIVSPELAFAGLMHDATEAYVNDISRPLKRHIPDYQKIEALNWEVIAEKFGLPLALPVAVHEADIIALRTEQNELMPALQQSQGIYAEASTLPIHCWSPAEAESKFLARFYELTRGYGAQLRFPNRPVVPLTDAVFA